MSVVYLWINAICYLVLGVMCAARPRNVAEYVGFQLGPGGVSEFVTVYGGLEFGLGLFFAFCAWYPDQVRTGIVFAACLYVPLALCRVVSLFATSPSNHNYQLAAVEVTLTIGAIACLLLRR